MPLFDPVTRLTRIVLVWVVTRTAFTESVSGVLKYYLACRSFAEYSPVKAVRNVRTKHSPHSGSGIMSGSVFLQTPVVITPKQL